MGLDSTIRLWNLDGHLESMKRDHERLDSIDDRIDGDLPDGLDFYRHVVLEPLHTVMASLDSPPAVNDLDELLVRAKEGPAFHAGDNSCQRLQLPGSKSNWAMTQAIPEFLEQRSERAAELWRTFTYTSDETYSLELLGEEYLFESSSTGLLRSAEVSELGTELSGLLGQTGDCYRRINRKYPEVEVAACEVRIVEFVRALCYRCSSGEVLTYRVSP